MSKIKICTDSASDVSVELDVTLRADIGESSYPEEKKE